LANFAVNDYEFGINRACKLVNLSKTVYYYKPKLNNDSEIKDALSLLVNKHPRRGFKKFFSELRQKGYLWNHKRVYRVYCEMSLNLRKKPKKRLPSREAQKLLQPIKINECWSVDFMSDATIDGRKFRTINVLDDFNREALTVTAKRNLPSQKVTEVLDEVAEWRGYPDKIRTDNGPEYISREFIAWAKKHGIKLCHIQPGKPAQNGYVERFNRTYREEVLDMYLFSSINEVEEITKNWLEDYNNNRPHESLKNMPPRKFARLHGGTPMTLLSWDLKNISEVLTDSTYNRY